MTHTWVELDSDIFCNNIAACKQIAGDAQIGAVLKSNAYGCGIYQIGALCDQNDAITLLCVGSLSEALALRAAGIKKKILVLSFIDGDPAQAANQKIAFTISSLEQATYLNTVGATCHTSFDVHLKVDTGLSRFGVTPDDTLAAIRTIQTLKQLNLVGIYTHLAEAQDAQSPFSQKQLSRFHAVVKQIKQAGTSIPYIHYANTAATLNGAPHCTMVRIGAGLYGLWPSEKVRRDMHARWPNLTIKLAIRWKSRIVEIKTIPAGISIGYNRSFITTRPTRIGLLPVGYHDGYETRLSNSGYVRINEHYAPIVGRVAMNITTIDITDIPNASTNSEVMLLGPYEHIDALDIAKVMGDVSVREVTARINPAIPRIIVGEGATTSPSDEKALCSNTATQYPGDVTSLP